MSLWNQYFSYNCFPSSKGEGFYWAFKNQAASIKQVASVNTHKEINLLLSLCETVLFLKNRSYLFINGNIMYRTLQFIESRNQIIINTRNFSYTSSDLVWQMGGKPLPKIYISLWITAWSSNLNICQHNQFIKSGMLSKAGTILAELFFRVNKIQWQF